MTAPNPADQPDADTDADIDPTGDAEAGGQGTGTTGTDQADLGDAGKKAIDAMKAKWRAERDRAKALEHQLAAATKPKQDDGPPDIDKLREQITAETRAEALKDKVLDKIEAKAARLFRDPEDALLRLGKNVDDYITDGKIDVEAITDALDDLLKKRPDFGVTQGEPKRFQGDADAGARGTAGKPQLTKADVERLAKEGKHAEIEQARQDGRLNELLGIT